MKLRTLSKRVLYYLSKATQHTGVCRKGHLTFVSNVMTIVSFLGREGVIILPNCDDKCHNRY